MQRLKILGLALVAVFALSAVVSATAFALPVVLPEPEEKWTGESGKSLLETLGGARIKCVKDKSEGTIEAKKPLGLFHITFEECKGEKGGFSGTCTGLGDKPGQILALGKYHLVNDKLGTPPGVGILFLLEHVHFICTIIIEVLVLVLGEVLCLIKPVNEKVKHFEIVCEQSKGDPLETVYWDENDKEVKMGLEGLKASLDDKTYEMSGQEGTALILTTNNIEIMG